MDVIVQLIVWVVIFAITVPCVLGFINLMSGGAVTIPRMNRYERRHHR